MPRTIVPVDNTDITVTRNIVKDVVRQLEFITRLPGFTLTYNNRLEQSATDTTLKLESSNQIHINYQETFDPVSIGVNRHGSNNLPIFAVSPLGIRAAPIHHRVLLDITVKISSRNWGVLNTWLAAIRREAIDREYTNLHNVRYEYTVPTPIVAYTANVHELSEIHAPLGLTISEFISTYYTKGIGVRHNLSDTARQLVVMVEQMGCLGLFTSIPETIETTDSSMSEIEFVYQLQYDRVDAIALDFQEFIHNTRADTNHLRNYIHALPVVPQQTGLQKPSDIMISDTLLIKDYHYMDVDRWVPDDYMPFTDHHLIIPVQIDPGALTTLFNLNDLNDSRIPVELLTIFTAHYARLTDQYKFPFHIELFAVGTDVRQLVLNCDNQLLLTTNLDMDLQQRHYIRISLINELHRVSLCFLLTEFSNMLYLLRYYNSKLNTVDSELTLDSIGDGTVATAQSLDAFVRTLRSTPKYYIGCTGVPIMYTTNTINVDVNKR